MPRDDRDLHYGDDGSLLDTSADASRQAPGGSDVDRTGFSEMMTIMLAVHQWVDAARASGFSPDQAFQLGRDYFFMMMHMSAERSDQ